MAGMLIFGVVTSIASVCFVSHQAYPPENDFGLNKYGVIGIGTALAFQFKTVLIAASGLHFLKVAVKYYRFPVGINPLTHEEAGIIRENMIDICKNDQ